MKTCLILLAVLPLFAACSKDSHAKTTTAKPPPTPDLSKEAAQAKDTVGAGVAEFQKTANETMITIDHHLAELKAKAAEATEDVKQEVSDAYAKLTEERQALGDKLAQMKTEAPSKAQSMMTELKSDLADLKKSVDDALAKYK